MNNRRTFLRGLFASTATIVVAPESTLEALDAVTHRRERSYFDAPSSSCAEIDDALHWIICAPDGSPSVWTANDRVWRRL